IQYATYLGGGWLNTLGGGGFDDRGNIYGSGSTDNENFPTTQGSFDPINNGFEDVYVFSISLQTPPSPPRNLQARSGDGFVNLTWDTPETPGSLDLIGFDIYRGESSLNETEFATVGDVLHFNDTDVENGKTYFYYIRAKNLALDSLPSLEVQATPLGLPGTPINFKALGGYMKVDLSWDPPLTEGGTPILGYRMVRTDDPNEFSIDIPPTSTLYTDEEIVAGRDYDYVITAYNLVGESIPSAPITATPVSEPSSPMDLDLRSGDGFVEISWEEPEMDGGMMIREYNLYRGISGAAPILLKTMGANVKKYNDTTVHNGLSYSYYVVAVNLIGESPATEPKEVIPMTLPGTPLSFIAVSGNEKVSMQWEEPMNDGGSMITSYRIRKVTGEEDPEFIDVVGLQYIDEDVENGETYTYSIASINSMGLSTWSKEVNVIPARPPEALELYLISKSETHVHIGWNEPLSDGGSEILSYELYKGIFDAAPKLYKTLDPGILNFNDTNVMPGTEYTYKVAAVNDVGPSPTPDDLVVIPAGVPSSPMDISLGLHDGIIVITWNEPLSDGGDGIIDYFVHRTEKSSGSSVSIDLEDNIIGPTFTYEDEDVIPGVTYEYYVTARNSIGHGAPSLTIEGTAYRAPEKITGLHAERKDGGIELTWNALDLAETGDVIMDVQRSVDGEDFLTIAMLDGSATGFTDSNVREGAEYTYRLVAMNDAGTSGSSEEVTVSLESSSSSGISGGGMAIMIIGTLIPILVAMVFFFLLFRRRKKEEPVAEAEDVPAMEATIPSEVTGSVLPPAAPAPQPEPDPMQQPIEEAPLPQEIPIGPAPASEEPQAPVPEEIPLQEAPNPFLDQPREEPVSEHEDFFKEVMQ
ncbi:MAG: fibronectin type III domain-containing protein, partial [Thermoplasmatota archaeon]